MVSAGPKCDKTRALAGHGFDEGLHEVKERGEARGLRARFWHGWGAVGKRNRGHGIPCPRATVRGMVWVAGEVEFMG